ncbi:MAG: hypothetical protein ABIS18_12010 [Actinomycetota bacterium]
MCVSCGCNVPDDDHGDEKHIVMEEVTKTGGADKISDDRFQKAAEAAGITTEQANQNVRESMETAATTSS